MTQVREMTALANEYLAERQQFGFDLTIQGSQIKTFARFVDESGYTGPLTLQLVLGRIKRRSKNATPFSWARRLETLRPFARYMTALDPVTEFPETAIFGAAHPAYLFRLRDWRTHGRRAMSAAGGHVAASYL
jgi:hypothetical protein